jgi:hypothetical protein
VVVAHEAVRQLSCVVARIRVIEAGGAFEYCLATAHLALPGQGDGQHRVPHGSTLAKRAAFKVAPCQVGAQRDHRMDLALIEPHDLCGCDSRAKDAEDWPGMEATRHHRRNPVRGHSFHHFVARRNGRNEVTP